MSRADATRTATSGFEYPVKGVKGDYWRHIFLHKHPKGWFFRVHDQNKFDQGQIKIVNDRVPFDDYKHLLPDHEQHPPPVHHPDSNSAPVPQAYHSRPEELKPQKPPLQELIELLKWIEEDWRGRIAWQKRKLGRLLRAATSEDKPLKSSQFWSAYLNSISIFKRGPKMLPGRKAEVLAMLYYVEIQCWKRPRPNNYAPVKWDTPKGHEEQEHIFGKGKSFSPHHSPERGMGSPEP